jgi:hypothetical protein
MLFRCVALLLFLALVIEDIKEAPEQRMRGRTSAPPLGSRIFPATCDAITRFAMRKLVAS